MLKTRTKEREKLYVYVQLLPRSAQFYVTYLENSNFILQLCFLFGWEALFVDDFDSYISSTFTMNACRVQKTTFYSFAAHKPFQRVCRNFRLGTGRFQKFDTFLSSIFSGEKGGIWTRAVVWPAGEPIKAKPVSVNKNDPWIGVGNCWSAWQRFHPCDRLHVTRHEHVFSRCLLCCLRVHLSGCFAVLQYM